MISVSARLVNATRMGVMSRFVGSPPRSRHRSRSPSEAPRRSADFLAAERRVEDRACSKIRRAAHEGLADWQREILPGWALDHPHDDAWLQARDIRPMAQLGARRHGGGGAARHAQPKGPAQRTGAEPPDDETRDQ